MSGLTAFVLDDAVLKRIALDRNVADVVPEELTQKDKDLLLADILFEIYMGPNNIPSFQHQHGQFSTSIGQQTFGSKDGIYNMMMRLYRKWGDEKADLIPESSLKWTM